MLRLGANASRRGQTVRSCREYHFQAVEQIGSTADPPRSENAKTRQTNPMASFEKCEYCCGYSTEMCHRTIRQCLEGVGRSRRVANVGSKSHCLNFELLVLMDTKNFLSNQAFFIHLKEIKLFKASFVHQYMWSRSKTDIPNTILATLSERIAKPGLTV